jgi:hypothetical protein
MVAESAHAPLPGKASEQDEEQTGDTEVMLCKIYLKIDNWDG